MISQTRRYRFAASHRLHVDTLSEAENAQLYGKCNNPYGHGHDYVLDVTIEGSLDETTGLLIPATRLDGFVDRNILSLFAHRNINVDVPQFASLAATTENVILVMAEILKKNWQSEFAGLDLRLKRLHIQETGRNGFEWIASHMPASDSVGKESVSRYGQN